MALRATTIVTIEQARSWVHGNTTEASDDATLEVCTDAASEDLEQRTGRKFKSTTITGEIGNGRGTRVHYLRYAPVTSITSITVDGVAPASYTLDGLQGRVVLPTTAVFPYGALILVTYVCGYGTIPAQAIEACLELTKRNYHLKTKGGQSFETVNVGGSTMVVRDRLPDDLMKKIAALKDTRWMA